MSTIPELVARLAEQVAELWNDRHDRTKSSFSRQTFAQFADECAAIAAEARAMGQGQGIGACTTENTNAVRSTTLGAAPAPDAAPRRWWLVVEPNDGRVFADVTRGEAEQCVGVGDELVEVVEASAVEAAVEAARANLILPTICRLPDVLTQDDWESWLEAHRGEWLSDDRGFGGWLALQLRDTLARLAQFDELANEAVEVVDGDSMGGAVGVIHALAALAPGEARR